MIISSISCIFPESQCSVAGFRWKVKAIRIGKKFTYLEKLCLRLKMFSIVHGKVFRQTINVEKSFIRRYWNISEHWLVY